MSSIPVALTRVDGYEDAQALDEAVSACLGAAGVIPRPGERWLLKPNMVSPKNARLSNTSAEVVLAACRVLLAHGAKVKVGDSPAFGTASACARATGLDKGLEKLGVRLITLGRPRPLKLSFGACIGLSRDAEEAEAILNLPRLKVHGQMKVSAAVKNLFGCVVGFRKALAHAQHGDQGVKFERLVLEVAAALPQSVHLVDGIIAMQRTGPIKGDPFPLGLLGASRTPHALDAALYGILGLAPQRVPLWREAAALGLSGVDPAQHEYPLAQPQDFDATGFQHVDALSPLTFHPARVVLGRVKSVMARFG